MNVKLGRKRAARNGLPALSGGWTAEKQLGKGGNSAVYAARSGERRGAYKLLARRGAAQRRDQSRQRFRSEIEAMRRCLDIKGVLPLIDCVDLDHAKAEDDLWLVTPVAEPFSTIEAGRLQDVVGLLAPVAHTLAALHARGFTHRDIKPENLFRLNGKSYVGDFGLASFAGKPDLTGLTERVGPLFYLAPEMLTGAHDADGRSADVFSLAKTLWSLAVGLKFPVPGQLLSYSPVFALDTYVPQQRAVQLHSLLQMATHPDPKLRPNMDSVADALDGWLAGGGVPVQVSSSPLVTSELLQKMKDNEVTQQNRLAAVRAEEQQVLEMRGRWSPVIQGEAAKIMRRLKAENLQAYMTEPADLSAGIIIRLTMPFNTYFMAEFRIIVSMGTGNGPVFWLGVSVEQEFTNQPPPLKAYREFKVLDGSAEAERAGDMISGAFDELFRVEFPKFVARASV